MTLTKAFCSRCGSPESAKPLPKRFACTTCGDRPFCYACDVTHGKWCAALPLVGVKPTTDPRFSDTSNPEERS